MFSIAKKCVFFLSVGAAGTSAADTVTSAKWLLIHSSNVWRTAVIITFDNADDLDNYGTDADPLMTDLTIIDSKLSITVPSQAGGFQNQELTIDQGSQGTIIQNEVFNVGFDTFPLSFEQNVDKSTKTLTLNWVTTSPSVKSASWTTFTFSGNRTPADAVQNGVEVLFAENDLPKVDLTNYDDGGVVGIVNVNIVDHPTESNKKLLSVTTTNAGTTATGYSNFYNATLDNEDQMGFSIPNVT